MSLFNVFKALDTALKALTVTEGVIDITDKARQTGNNQLEPPDVEAEDIRIAAARSRLSEENAMGEKEVKTVIETLEVEAQNLLDRIKELLHEGNIRKVTVRDSKGKYLIEVPLTVGVLAGGVFALTAPGLTALTAIAGALTNVKIEVERIVEEAESDEQEATAEE